MSRHSLIILILILLTCGIYAQVRQHGFIDYDDPGYVRDNPIVQRGLTAENLWWALTTRTETNWHPVTWLSHMLDCQVFGPNRPGWHHLVSLFWHIVNVVLVFALFSQTTGRTWQAAFVAALFATHPLHVESVAWIAERKDVLSTFFWLMSLHCYARYASQRAWLPYGGCLLFLAIGLATKPMLVTAPFLYLLLDYWPLGRWWSDQSLSEPSEKSRRQEMAVSPKRGVDRSLGSQDARLSDQSQTSRQAYIAPNIKWLLIEKLPMLVLVIASCLMTYHAQKVGGAVAPQPSGHRLENALVSYVRYLGKTFWPQDLAVLYPNLTDMWNLWQVAGALALLLVISAVILQRWRRRYLTVGWCWFLGTLVPVIGIIQVGQQAMADRYMYFPLIGLAVMLAWGGADLLQARPKMRPWVTTVAVGAIVCCCGLTFRQVQRWRQSESLFVHTLAVTQNNYVIHNNYGVILQDQGRNNEALDQYRRAISANPDYADAHYNLARAYQGQQQFTLAVEHYQLARKLRPRDANTLNNLAGAYHLMGQLDKAVVHYQKALDINPEHVESTYNLASAMRDKKEWDSAIELYQRVVQLKPDHFGAHNNLGVLWHLREELVRAIYHYRQALAINTNHVEAHMNLAVALEAQGKRAEALRHVEIVLKAVPDHKNASRTRQRLRQQKTSPGQADQDH
ncbi:MAG: tetratricopeptide repeat protein [Pirellulaceae bacterium]|nr:tetratricopeptide repeat protein [Pirellulaceae bacterium]